MLNQESIHYLEELIDWDISEINQTLTFLKGQNGGNTDIQIKSYQKDLERALRVKKEINNNNGNI